MNPQTKEPLAFSMDQAADALTVCNKTVYRLIRRGELKALRVGRRVIVPVEELHRLLQRTTVKTT